MVWPLGKNSVLTESFLIEGKIVQVLSGEIQSAVINVWIAALFCCFVFTKKYTSDVFTLEEPVIQKAIEIRKKHKTKLPDAIIAAIAVVNELTIITRNTKDFKKIEGLEVLNPHEN